MTLPVSPNTISFDNIRTEAGLSGTVSMNQSEFRVIATRAYNPGTNISMSQFHGKTRQLIATGVNDEQTYDTEFGSGVANTYPTVTRVGGSGTFTYLWSFTSNPQGAGLALGTTQSPRVYESFTSGSTGLYSATLQCVVTDTLNGEVSTATGITAISEWANGLQ